MRRYETTARRVAVTAMLLAVCCCVSSVGAQEVWPGDINANGAVNGIDLLYLGVAEGKAGPERFDQGDDWQAYTAGPQWTESFSDGTNYKLADTDGTGTVEYNDRLILWVNNYGMTQSTYVPDNYPVANSMIDPTLQLTPASTTVLPGDTLEFDLHLGDALTPISNLYGISFKLTFDEAWVKDETSAPMWDPDVVNLSVENGPWPAPTSGNELEPFLQLQNVPGQVEMVIMRELPESAGGHGQIASIMVIIEDVVMLEDVATDFVIEDIVLVDENLNTYPVAGSTATITIGANSSALVAEDNGEETATEERTAGVETPEVTPPAVDQWTPGEIVDEGFAQVTIFPNPVVNQLQANTGSTVDVIENMQLFAADGKLVRQQANIQASSATMDVSSLPQGNYILQLETTTGTTVKQINK